MTDGLETSDAVGTLLMLFGMVPALVSLYGDLLVYLEGEMGSFWAETLVMWGSGIVGMGTLITAFAVIELTCPDVLKPYRLQREKRDRKFERMTVGKYFDGFHLVVINQTIAFFLAYFSTNTYWRWRREGAPLSAPLPTYPMIMAYCAFSGLMVEVVFYTSHRLFHWDPLYKAVHSVHHKFRTPFSWTATACHPIEHIFSNILSVVAGPMILGTHPAFSAAWITFSTMTTTFSHSGYALPFCPSASTHDRHHEYVVENFGVMGLLDTLLGTNKEYLADRAKEAKSA